MVSKIASGEHSSSVLVKQLVSVQNVLATILHFLLNLEQARDVQISRYNLAGERTFGTGTGMRECVTGIYLARIKANGVEKKIKVAVAR